MEDIIKIYLQIAEEKGRLPTYSDFYEKEIKKDKIKHHFVNLSNLHNYVEDNHLEELSKFIAHESEVFSKLKLKELSEDIKKYDRFFITTAVAEKTVHKGFYDAIQNYCQRNNAKLLLLPAADMFSRRKQAKWVFDKTLNNESFIFVETKLNQNIFLSSIKISAKQILPTTGLSRIGQRNGSYIFASPKQNLEYISNSADNDRMPRAMMTPGALTIADYEQDKYMSERISYIAQQDHVMGGIIVEIDSPRVFHFRQVQADPKGAFIDLGIQYNPDGTTQKESATFAMGDWHSGSTDPKVKKGIEALCKEILIDDLVVHDLFDGKSINHHIDNEPLKKAKRVLDNKHSLSSEIAQVATDLTWMLDKVAGNIIVVKSNHDEWLEQYLARGKYVYDAQNHYMSLGLAKAYLDGQMPLMVAVNDQLKDVKLTSRIIWLDRDEEYKVAGIELGQHGDIGTNGSRGSLQGAERAYGLCVIGHAHGAAILRGVYRVGTSTYLRLDYNRGASTWTQTGCLVYKNGSRQLINFVNGNYKKKGA